MEQSGLEFWFNNDGSPPSDPGGSGVMDHLHHSHLNKTLLLPFQLFQIIQIQTFRLKKVIQVIRQINQVHLTLAKILPTLIQPMVFKRERD